VGWLLAHRRRTPSWPIPAFFPLYGMYGMRGDASSPTSSTSAKMFLKNLWPGLLIGDQAEAMLVAGSS